MIRCDAHSRERIKRAFRRAHARRSTTLRIELSSPRRSTVTRHLEPRAARAAGESTTRCPRPSYPCPRLEDRGREFSSAAASLSRVLVTTRMGMPRGKRLLGEASCAAPRRQGRKPRFALRGSQRRDGHVLDLERHHVYPVRELAEATGSSAPPQELRLRAGASASYRACASMPRVTVYRQHSAAAAPTMPTDLVIAMRNARAVTCVSRIGWQARRPFAWLYCSELRGARSSVAITRPRAELH